MHVKALSTLLADKARCSEIAQVFTEMHHTLKQDTAARAAEAILPYLSPALARP